MEPVSYTHLDVYKRQTQFFMGHGISLRHIGIIQENYKEQTLEILQNHPYQLVEDIDGIGFKTADELALKTGGTLNNPDRLKAGVIYSIKQSCFSSGSTYVLYDEIKKAFHKIIYHIDDEVFDEYLNTLVEEGRVIKEGEYYYDEELYESEEIIANFLHKINDYPEEFYDENELERLLDNYQDKFGIVYSTKQKEAIEYFLKYPMMILTGGPGTGKTTVVKALIQIYRTLYPKDAISLVAPTGRAAKRLSELTGLDACTIHRELKWDLHKNSFAMNRNNPLSSQVLIIDEFSMVDSLLLSKLFDASRRVHKVLFIGDYHQLPSVAPGNVLKDFIESQLKVIELDEIYRQSKDSGIVQLAHQLIHQEVNDLSLFEQYKDIHFYNSTNFEIIKNVTTIVKKAIENGYDQNDIQVLAPIYQGVAGINALNLALQEIFNPKNHQEEYRIGQKVYREGDKILQLKNRPDDDIYNGDIGVLVEINRKDGFEYLEDTLIVDYDGNLVEYTSKDFMTFTLAYCMSIHKAQGNEFKIVIKMCIRDRTLAALQDLNEMMKKRHHIEKSYMTICKGKLTKQQELVGYVKKIDNEDRVRFVKKDDKDALMMKTIVKPIRTTNDFSLVEVKIITGRMHQIRIHLSSIDHPVIGDRKYGDFVLNKQMKQQFGLNNQLLHAYKINFVDPFGSLSYLKGKKIICPKPTQFKKIEKSLFESVL